MKYIKSLAIVILLLFIIAFVPDTGFAAPAQTPSVPVIGDTLIYAVTTWNAPDLLDLFSEGVADSNINLVGSEIGIKILNIKSDYYEWGAYVRAGNGPISITIHTDALPEESSPLLNDLFVSFLTGSGDLVINVPAHIAFPVVSSMRSMYNVSQLQGLPLWLKNVNWTQIKEEALSNSTDPVDYSENLSTNTATITLISEEGTNHSQANLSLTYVKSTETLFTALELKGKIADKFGVLHDINVVISYARKVSAPLPAGFGVGDIFKYEYGTSSLNIEYTLNSEGKSFINSLLAQNPQGPTNIDGLIGFLEGEVNSKEGQAFGQVTIKNVEGVSYTGEYLSAQLGATPSNITINGFYPVFGLGPVMTPDWDMWDGLVIFDNALGNIYTQFFDVDTAAPMLKANYTNIGLTRGPNFGYQASFFTENGIHYTESAFHVDLEFNSATINRVALNIPSTEVIPEGVVNVEVNVAVRVAHTTDGYLLGLGIFADISSTFDITIPADLLGPMGGQIGSDIPIEGSFDALLQVGLKLSSSSSGIDQSVKDKAATLNPIPPSTHPIFNTGTSGQLTTSPGFEVFTLLGALIIVPIITRKMRK